MISVAVMFCCCECEDVIGDAELIISVKNSTSDIIEFNNIQINPNDSIVLGKSESDVGLSRRVLQTCLTFYADTCACVVIRNISKQKQIIYSRDTVIVDKNFYNSYSWEIQETDNMNNHLYLQYATFEITDEDFD